jgi:hypothetical protein
MPGPKYPLTIRFRATRADARDLKKLAAHLARSESDTLRLLVGEAWARVEAREAKKKGHEVATP